MPKAPLLPIATLGIDIGKNSFHLIGLDTRGAIVLRQKLSRSQVEQRLANMPTCLIGMEACVGAHHLSRQLLALGHDVKLIPAQFVKPFRKSHKNDFRDAEAIAEAVLRPTMRFVPTKTVEQLDLQALHRVRARLVSQRTAVLNQIRTFLLERGIAVRQGLRALRQALPDILAQRTDVLTPRMTRLIEGLVQDWHHLDERIDAVTDEIEALVAADEACQRLMSVPGVGPIIASAMVAAIGNGAAFQRGRDFGAWLGLVPQQRSTGDRTILGRLSKRGNTYLRSLLVQAARVLLWPAKWRQHSFGAWLTAASTRLHHNVLAAALANKLARIAWSVLSQNRTYEPRTAAVMGWGQHRPCPASTAWSSPRSARGRRDGERSRRRIWALVTRLAMMGRSGYENRCARICIMARSTARYGPDTLAQDQFTISKASCDARPVHTNGSSSVVPQVWTKVRFLARFGPDAPCARLPSTDGGPAGMAADSRPG